MAAMPFQKCHLWLHFMLAASIKSVSVNNVRLGILIIFCDNHIFVSSGYFMQNMFLSKFEARSLKMRSRQQVATPRFCLQNKIFLARALCVSNKIWRDRLFPSLLTRSRAVLTRSLWVVLFEMSKFRFNVNNNNKRLIRKLRNFMVSYAAILIEYLLL